MSSKLIYDSIETDLTPYFQLINFGVAAVPPFTNAFNGSVVNDKYIVRLDKIPFFQDRKIAICEWNHGNPTNPKILNFKTLNGHAEDPRAFNFNGREACLFNDGGRMYLGFIDDETCYPLVPPIKKNIEHDGREKNWSPFIYDGKLHVMYAPGRIIEYEDNIPKKEYISEPPKINFGKIRGGTQIVEYNNRLYTIFHTVKSEGNYKFYLAGILELENEPPFKSLRYSKIPLWKPSFITYDDIPPAPHRLNPIIIFVTFPSHLEIDKNGNALVVAGTHDYTDTIIKFNIDDVLNNLSENKINPIQKLKRDKTNLGPVLNKQPRKIVEDKIIKQPKKPISPDLTELLKPKNNVPPRPQNKEKFFSDVNPIKTQQELIRQTLIEQKKNTTLSQLAKEMRIKKGGGNIGGKFST